MYSSLVRFIWKLLYSNMHGVLFTPLCFIAIPVPLLISEWYDSISRQDELDVTENRKPSGMQNSQKFPCHLQNNQRLIRNAFRIPFTCAVCLHPKLTADASQLTKHHFDSGSHNSGCSVALIAPKNRAPGSPGAQHLSASKISPFQLLLVTSTFGGTVRSWISHYKNTFLGHRHDYCHYSY